MIKKAIVLAAGKGIRLMPLTRAIPKEMIRVGLKPTIEHVIEVLKAGGNRGDSGRCGAEEGVDLGSFGFR